MITPPRPRPLALAALCLAGCGASPSPGTDAAPAPTDGAASLGRAIALSRDLVNVTGSINTVDLSSHAVKMALDTTIDADNLVRPLGGGRALVLDKLKGTLRHYDTGTWAVLAEIALGDATHKPDSAYAIDAVPTGTGHQVLVSLSGNDAAHALGIVDLDQPAAGITRFIAVAAAAADMDGKPEVGAIFACNGKHYVVCDDLDSLGTFDATGPGRIAVVDTAAGMTTGFIQLHFQDPALVLAVDPADCTQALAFSSGRFDKAPGPEGGIERVDLGKGQDGAALFDGSALGGVPGSGVIASPHLGYAVLSYDLQMVVGQGYSILARTRLVAFDPTAGTLLGDASGPAGYLPFAAVSPDGQLFFGVDDIANVDTTGNMTTGLYVGRADGKNGPYTRLDLGQRPTAMAFEVP